MNKKSIKLFRLLTVLMSLAMLLNSSSMTVLATGIGDFFDDSEEIVINPLSNSYGNLIYALDENGNAFITGNTITEDTDLIIPSDIDGHKVVSIVHCAFQNCYCLTGITIPKGVTSIGADAFYGCKSLTSINLPEGVTSIGDYAFYGCESLTSISIPNGVTSIGDCAFQYCYCLTGITIPKGVTSIGEGAFSGCESLTNINLPEGVTSIGEGAFSGCESLTNINLPEGVTSIGDCAFYGCESLTSISIPNGVTSIETYTFGYCYNLTSITIPKGVTSIGEGAFDSCISLTSINLPEGVTSIGDYAFYGCESLTSISIPNGVTSIGECAFYGCESLTSISIPNGVTSIETCTFGSCYNLSSITIPESVNRIEDDAFDGAAPNMAIHGTKGSYAEEWANNHGIKFWPLGAVTEITLNKTSLDLSVNDSETLTATIKPDDATNKAVNWTSTNTKVATVDANGLVKAVGIGSAKITVTAADECGAIATCEVTVTQPVTKITLNKTSLNLSVNRSETLTATVKPDNASDKAVNWKSTNTKVATVDANGLVKAVGAGSATITATAADGSGVKATCEVTVTQPVTKITLNKTSLNLSVNKSETLTATVNPDNASNKAVNWTSTNTKVATVDANGLVKAVGVGSATIAVTATDGSGVKATCKVTVTQPVTKITLNKTSLNIALNKSETLTATVNPDNASNKAVNWKSTNTKVATVDANGLVKAVGVGSATITATAADGSGVKATCKVTVTQPVTEITLDKTSLNLSVGNSETLTATVKPNNVTNKAVNWSSTNTKVATVDSAGKVTAVGVGSATITATAADGSGVKATCKVTVTQPVTKITLDKTSLNLSVGNSETLTATIKPDNATNKAVNWSSTNTKVATVDSAGNVTAVGVGSATITATAADGSGVKATCKVTVTQPVTKITLNKTSLNLSVNKSETLTATVNPDNASNKAVNWTSTNANVATVDSAGNVTAVGVGSATITATAADGSGVKATCKVTVTQPVTKITLNKTSLNLSVNKSETLTATVKPDNATNKAVNWKSTNTKVATVDANGLVKAVGVGSATITATAADGSGVKATCKVTVTQPVTEITLNKTSLNLSVNKSETLTATVKPDNASDKEVNWKSTNTKVATVDSTGKVTAVGVGSASITATAADGSGVKATCKITVVKLVSEITLDKTDIVIHVGESDTINATVTPADASNKEITWGSTNTEVATVDSTGKVTAVGVGTATITVTATDESGISASATIKVTKLVTDVFDDVKSTDWFVKSVQYVYDHGIMAGTNGGKSFSPNGKLTREQFTQVLYAYEGKPDVANMSGFSDVDPKAWYAKSVYWAKEKGITGGKPDGTFGVNENISRQDLAVMLYTYAKIKNYDLTKNDNALDNFDDKGKVSNYAKDAMKWAVTQGVISGKGNGKVDPTGNATRAECATMIMKLIEKNK